MSGHSKWATTKHKKAIIDSRRAKNFAKLIKAIEVSARAGGADVSGNPTLFDAIAKAKKNSVPADNIDRAIKRGAGVGGVEAGAFHVGGVRGAGRAEQGDQRFDLGEGGGFVERDAEGGGVDRAQVDLLGEGVGVDFRRVDVAHREGVEDRLGVDGGPGGAQAGGEQFG